jgi:hypothetical protein
MFRAQILTGWWCDNPCGSHPWVLFLNYVSSIAMIYFVKMFPTSRTTYPALDPRLLANPLLASLPH